MSEPWSRPLLLVLLALVVLGSVVWLPRRAVPARSVMLLGSLLPSWRFFDQVAAVPVLRYRVAPHGDDWGDWQAALAAPARTPGSLWLNAAGNLHLACQSLVEHLAADLEASPRLAAAENQLVSYRLVCALIERQLGTPPWSPLLRYQFCLVDTEPAEPAEAPPLLFLSNVHGPA